MQMCSNLTNNSLLFFLKFIVHFKSCYITLIPQLYYKFLAYIYIQATNNDLYLNVGYYIHTIGMCYFYLVTSLAILVGCMHVGCMHERACVSACTSVRKGSLM